MSKGRATGSDREYQQACCQLLKGFDSTLQAWSGDGIDVTVPDVCGTPVTFDVLLKTLSSAVVAAECKRWKLPVDQGRLLEFAQKVEGLRKRLGLPISPFFFVKRGAQKGTLMAAENLDIVVIERNEGDMTDALTFRYLGYDPERERRITEGIASLRESVQIQETVVLRLEDADSG